MKNKKKKKKKQKKNICSTKRANIFRLKMCNFNREKNRWKQE